MNKIIGIVAGLSLIVPVVALADSNVTATADAHSSIDPSGLTIVVTGDTQSFGISVDSGYTANVYVDGASQGNVSSVNITGDSTDHSISVKSGPVGAGTQPYCSGPTAPGWRADLADGGCGGAKMHIVVPGTPGCGYWNVQGCVVKE